MTTDCSWNYHEQSFVILWVSWRKNKCFWKRFTCTLYLIYMISPNFQQHFSLTILHFFLSPRMGWGTSAIKFIQGCHISRLLLCLSLVCTYLLLQLSLKTKAYKVMTYLGPTYLVSSNLFNILCAILFLYLKHLLFRRVSPK